MVDSETSICREANLQPDNAEHLREPLPAAAPGESLRPYVVRVAPILTAWLDRTRRWRRRAEWGIIRAAVEVAYGEPVAQRTLETYLAAARKAGGPPPVQVTPEPPATTPPPTPSDRASSGDYENARRSRASSRAPAHYQRFIAPRS